MFIDSIKDAVIGGVVLVTGSSGMTGASLLRVLTGHGVRVKAVYNQTVPRSMIADIEYLQIDLREREKCRTIMSGCDCVIMLAADSYRGTPPNSPCQSGAMTSNLVMDCNVIESAVATGVRRIIYLSSATVYQSLDKPISEDDLDLNKAPDGVHLNFAWQKRYIETMCYNVSKQHGVESVVIRPSNIYGPFAPFDPMLSNFIPALIRKASDKQDPFEVYGDRNIERDVIYVDDLVNALMMILARKSIRNEVFNIGSGMSVRVDDVVNTILKCSGHKPKEIKYLSNDRRVVTKKALDISKITAATGWKPEISLEEGITRTMCWWQENKGWWKK